MRFGGRSDSRPGFVLALMSGVLSLLLMVSIALLQVAGRAHLASAAASAEARSSLAAASGMEYAASRLAREGSSRYQGDPGSRGDDWTCREPDPAPRSPMQETGPNPSYSHGEPWRNDPAADVPGKDDDGDGIVDEPGEGGGIWQAGEPWEERDGDGRFSAWSGRLRGEAAPFSLRFSLRIESAQSTIPLNAGALWKEDLHGYSGSPTGGPNGIPDHRDPDVPCHTGLVRCLDSLGAILHHEDPPLLSTRCEDVPTGDFAGGNPGEPFRVSWLGHDLIRLRPAGGYRSWTEVERTLTSLPASYAGDPYKRSELDAIRPYLDLGPYQTFPGTCRTGLRDSPMVAVGKRNPLPADVPILLARAPRKVLQALWMYLANPTTGEAMVGSKGLWTQAPCARMGDPGSPSTRTYSQLNFFADPNQGIRLQILFPDEALALADAAARFRQGPEGFLWRAFYETLIREAPTIFKQDFQELEDPAHPLNALSWVQGKADTAFLSVCMDPNVGGIRPCGSATWGSWGIDRDGDPANGVQPNQAFDAAAHAFAKHPESFPAGPWMIRFPFSPDRDRPDPFAPFMQLETYGRRAQGVTLAPPMTFRVGSVGVDRAPRELSRALSGLFRAGEILQLGSEEDFDDIAGEYFEPLGQGTWTSRGISVHDPDPAARHDLYVEPDPSITPQRRYPSMTTLPRFNRRASCGTPANALYGAQGDAGFRGCSPYFGALTLAPHEGGRWNAVQYWPFQDDFLWDPGLLSPTSTLGTDFWSEPSGSDRLRLPCDPAWLWNPDSLSSWFRDISYDLTLHPTWHCPGFEPGQFVSNATFEWWMSDGSVFTVLGDGWSNTIQLRTRRVEYDDEQYATGFLLSVGWDTAVPFRGATLFPPIVVPDSALPEGSPRSVWTYHVVMEIEPLPTGAGIDMTRFRFFINGLDRDPETGLPYELDYFERDSAGNSDGKMKGTDREYLFASQVDEIRVYSGFLGLSGARARHGQGRFVRRGGFTSPLYAFDRPVRMLSSSWNGLVPPVFLKPDAVGGTAPLDPFRVTATGFRTRPDDPGHPQPPGGVTVDIPKDAIGDLSGLGEIRSFQYRVELDCRDLIGPLDDTPIFESIWFTIRRKGYAPAWTAWQSR